MFRQSRKKIIISIMGSVILLFAMTLFVIFFVSYRNMRARNIDMMSRHTWRKARFDKETEPNGQKDGESRPDQGKNE